MMIAHSFRNQISIPNRCVRMLISMQIVYHRGYQFIIHIRKHTHTRFHLLHELYQFFPSFASSLRTCICAMYRVFDTNEPSTKRLIYCFSFYLQKRSFSRVHAQQEQNIKLGQSMHLPSEWMLICRTAFFDNENTSQKQ